VKPGDNLTDERGWPLRNDKILSFFGLPPSVHIPKDMEATRMIGNVKVRIVRPGQLPIKRRVVADCPVCKKTVCAGHLHQHMKVHNNGK
jgi:hypothetical protein